VTRVLVTAFEPFGGWRVNASAAAVALLPDRIGDVEVVRAVLPCIFDEAPAVLRGLIEAHGPDAVVAVGEAGGRTSVDVERVAINVDDARIADNSGARPIDRAVVDGGPVAYLSTLPIKACARAGEATGVPVSVSNTAGTFVCNHVFYWLQHVLADRPSVRSGFVHVPTVDRLDSADAARALAAIVEAAAITTVDVRESRGSED
jgi:pyroglutamyl-peptidase